MYYITLLSMEDPIKAFFDGIAIDGVIRTESEWETFVHGLETFFVPEKDERELFSRIWKDEVLSKTSFGKEASSGPEISFQMVQRKIMERYGGVLGGTPEIRSNLEGLDQELATLNTLVDRWSPQTIGVDHTRQLLSLLAGLESSFSASKAQTQALVTRQRALLDAIRVRNTVIDQLQVKGDFRVPPPNPFVYQREFRSVIEARLARDRVRSLRFADKTVARPLNDRFGLGGACFHCIGLQKRKGGSSVEVDLTAVDVPLSHESAYSKAWSTYSALREMTLSPYFLTTFGMNDASFENVSFYYEYVPSSTISVAQFIAHHSQRSSADYEDYSPLFHHWIFAALGAFVDLEKMSTFDYAPPSLENLLLSNQGATLRVGDLAWESAESPAAQLAGRSVELLRGWADVVDDLLQSASPAAGPNVGHKETKTYTEDDVKSGGIYVWPGESFNLVLSTTTGREDTASWCYPFIDDLSGEDVAPSVELESGVPNHPILSTEDHSSIRVSLVALRPGRCNLIFRGPGDHNFGVPTLNVPITVQAFEMSPVLKDILRCCRATPKGNGHPQISLSALASHRYFSAAPSLEQVTALFRKSHP